MFLLLDVVSKYFSLCTSFFVTVNLYSASLIYIIIWLFLLPFYIGDPSYRCEKHGLFGSYRVQSDLEYMTALVRAIETCDVSRQKYLTMFFDRNCLPIGEDWEKGFVNCLQGSGSIILLVSPEGVERCKTADTTQDNFLLELELATNLHAKHKAAVVPIFLIDRDYPGGHIAFLNELKTRFPKKLAKHPLSRKTIATTLRAVAQLPGAFHMFRGDDFSQVSEKIADQCASSKFPPLFSPFFSPPPFLFSSFFRMSSTIHMHGMSLDCF